jgi:hypothetical protein
MAGTEFNSTQLMNSKQAATINIIIQLFIIYGHKQGQKFSFGRGLDFARQQRWNLRINLIASHALALQSAEARPGYDGGRHGADEQPSL